MRALHLAGIVAVAVLASTAGAARAEGGFVLMASTIGPIDAGIVPLLEERFELETGVRVRHVGAGTGEALKISEKGAVDLVLVHARKLEEKFVRDGFGTERIPLMYNDFVIVGPKADPAGIRSKGIGEALAAIAVKGARFVSRGDRSGTHVAEMDLWAAAGLKPAGAWYEVYEKGSEGNSATLKHADQRQAYTLIDRATWLSLRKGLDLAVLVEKDEALLNFISLIPVSPRRFPKVNHQGAMAFATWLTAPTKGQKVIRDFGKDRYGEPLFFPDSREWRSAQKK